MADDDSRSSWERQRDYMDRVIRDMRTDIADAAALALAGERDRVRTTLDALNHRLDELNNFKDALATQTLDFPTREVVTEMIKGVEAAATSREERIRHLEQDKASGELVAAQEARIRVLEGFRANLTGRFWALGAGLTIAVVVVNVVIYLLSRHP